MHRIRRGLFGSIFNHPHLRFFTAETGGEGGGDPTDDSAGSGGQEGDEKPAEDEDEPLGEAGLKALHREREAAKAEREARREQEKQIQEMTERLKQFEDAAKTEEEKQAEAAEEARKQAEQTATELASAKAMNLRYEVAADKGIDIKLAHRLAGSTREELEKDADALKELIGSPAPQAPRPDPSAGRGGEPMKPRTLNEAIGQHYS